MSRWITVGGPEWLEMNRKTNIRAYQKWVGSTEQPQDDSFYTVRWHRWVTIFLSPQDEFTIQILRDHYTKKTGKDWKTAKLSEVEKELGYCKELTYPVQQIFLGGGTKANGSTPSEYLTALALVWASERKKGKV